VIRIAPVSLRAIVRRLDAGTPLVFSRWGDGEWRCVLGYSGRNCDGHPYSLALRVALSRVLEARPPYWLGMQPFAVRSLSAPIEAWLGRRHLAPTWIDADVFHRTSIEQRLDPLLHVLRMRPVVIVGPSYLQSLSVLPHAALIPIPEQNCYAAYDDVLVRVREKVARCSTTICVAVSAGMMANVLIHDLYVQFPQHTFIDFGSLWDPYAGRVTRGYHRKILQALCA